MLIVPFFHRFRRFLVIFTDHSTPDNGDLHIAPNNVAATSIDSVRFIFFYSTDIKATQLPVV